MTPYSEIIEQINTEILFLIVTTNLTFTILNISSPRVKASKFKFEGLWLLVTFLFFHSFNLQISFLILITILF